MNWSNISADTVVGKALRWPLKLLPSEMIMPILQGKLKGSKWIVGSGVNGYWLGSYEFNKQLLFSRTIAPESTVFDIGGHVGFYTLLASKLVGPKGKVYVFEPAPHNLYYLKQNLQINHVNNVTIIEAAVANENGVTFFDEGPNSSMGYLAPKGSVQVKTVALDDLVSKQELPLPDYIKIDIEGAEMMALSGAQSILAASHPTIFLATHGQAIHQACCAFLRSHGYQLQSIEGLDINQSSEVMAVYRAS